MADTEQGWSIRPNAKDAAMVSAVHSLFFVIMWATLLELPFRYPTVLVVAPLSAFLITRFVWRESIATRSAFSWGNAIKQGLVVGFGVYLAVTVWMALVGGLWITAQGGSVLALPSIVGAFVWQFVFLGVVSTLGVPIASTTILVVWLARCRTLVGRGHPGEVDA